MCDVSPGFPIVNECHLLTEESPEHDEDGQTAGARSLLLLLELDVGGGSRHGWSSRGGSAKW